MTPALEQRLVDRFPHWFDRCGDIRETAMSRGFECGDGWFDLIRCLCEKLEPLVAAAEQDSGKKFEVLQVKAKFSSLRFHPNITNDAIAATIESAEVESRSICEFCGDPGMPIGPTPINTRCLKHTVIMSSDKTL